MGDKFSGAMHITDQGTQFTSEKYTEWATKMNIETKHSTVYRAMNNQYAEALVRRVKNCIRDTRQKFPDIKINKYRLQMQLNNLMHENMEGQEATAHQTIYMTDSQDEHIEQNFRKDWP